jgi:hypothetical protein
MERSILVRCSQPCARDSGRLPRPSLDLPLTTKSRVKILHCVSGRLIIAAIACSLAASTPIQAQDTKSGSASGSSGDSARLVVNRAANFGILESVNVFVDGVQVAELELSQSYDAVLRPGQHVLSVSINPKNSGQKPTQRRVDAKPGKTYAFTAVWRSAEYASLEQ